MKESFGAWRTEETLKRSREDVLREAIPEAEWDRAPHDACCITILFNLEAAFDEGHAILALGPIDGPLETYSFYRHGNRLVAPAIMACLREPMTFTQIVNAQGWIVHGQPGDYWNEHVNAALTMWCTRNAYNKIRAFAEGKKADPGKYDLVKYNCLTFVEEALGTAGIKLQSGDGASLHTFIPKDAFRAVQKVSGAHRHKAWKYWFELSDAPKNGLRTIEDTPGKDRPLK